GGARSATGETRGLRQRATASRPARPRSHGRWRISRQAASGGTDMFEGYTASELTAILAMQGFSGLSLFCVFLLMALGLAIIFGQMQVINMAHGEFLTIGAYTTYL